MNDVVHDRHQLVMQRPKHLGAAPTGTRLVPAAMRQPAATSVYHGAPVAAKAQSGMDNGGQVLRTRIAGLTVVIGAIVAVGCMDQSRRVTAPLPSQPTSTSRSDIAPPRSHDAEWSSYASALPGFGGMYYADNGDLVVYMTDTTRTGTAWSTLGRYVGHQHRPAYLPPLTNVPTMRFARANYDFPTLLTFKQIAQRLVRNSLSTFAGLGIDERHNQLRVAMTTSASAMAMQNALVGAGIPANALELAPI